MPGCPQAIAADHGGEEGLRMDIVPPLEPGKRIAILLAGGQRFEGDLVRCCGRWLELADGATLRWLNSDHIVLIAGGAGALPSVPPPSKRKPVAGGGGPPWQDEDLRLLADALLDGVSDAELGREFGRKPGEIGVLRRAFACLRGDLLDEDLDAAARSWLPRLRGLWHVS